MHPRKIVAVVGLLALLWLAGCGSPALTPAEIPGSGPERGAALFELNPLGNAPGCATCHSLTTDVTLIGPSLAHAATLAAQQETGLSAEAYLRQAILEPDAHLATGFNPGAMPAYGSALSEQDVDDLVAYLMTLE